MQYKVKIIYFTKGIAVALVILKFSIDTKQKIRGCSKVGSILIAGAVVVSIKIILTYPFVRVWMPLISTRDKWQLPAA